MPISDRDTAADARSADKGGLNEAQLRLLLQGMHDGICVIEVLVDGNGRPENYRIIEANPTFESLTDLQNAVDRKEQSAPVERNARWLNICRDVAVTGLPRKFEQQAGATDTWHEIHAFPIGEAVAKRIAVVFKDITGRKQAEQAVTDSEKRTQRLLAELQHRVRNTLAVIRSIVRRSAETSATIDDYAMHLDGRIAAYAGIQSTTTQNPDNSIELGMIVADTLQAAMAREGETVRIAGPNVKLRSKAAETIGLAVHELTTNALKFGALATTGGRIDIRWSLVRDDQDAPVLDFRWTETGLAQAAKLPLRAGFGTEQLTKTLEYDLDAETRTDVHGDTIAWSIRNPLSDRVAAHDDT